MARQTPVPKFPLRFFLGIPEVRQHLANAGKECALALRAGLGALKAEVGRARLDEQYPYLRAALHNLTSTVTRAAGGLQGRPRRPRRKVK